MLVASLMLCAALGVMQDPVPPPEEAPAEESQQPAVKPIKLLGPLLGGVSDTEARVWCRAETAGLLTIYVFSPDGKPHSQHVLQASEEHDYCVTFELGGLKPGTRYAYKVVAGPPPKEAPKAGDGGVSAFTTAPDPAAKSRVSIAFGSCDMDKFDQPQLVWGEMLRQRVSALCLIGDTPYIDSTKLEVQRDKYRAFFSIPEFIAARRVTPTFAIWDDHDFGANDTNGKLKGKEHALQAFSEYHSNLGTQGNGTVGVYHSFRMGAVEVFMLDARWFSNTEPSFADPSKPTLLGSDQWAWLKKGLKDSTAPFKLLVTGMVWHDNVREKKTDYWGAYPYERAAILAFIEENKIGGVVLVGGDVHRSRTFRHPQSWSGVSYPIYEVVASPLGSATHANAEVPDADLLADAAAAKSFCVITADTTGEKPTLTTRWHTGLGDQPFAWQATLEELTPGHIRVNAAAIAAPRDEAWKQLHARHLRLLETANPEVVFLGDSITEGWAGAGKGIWAERWGEKAVNLGIGGDQTQHVLWRLRNGALEGLKKQATPPRVAVVMIGTNNTGGAAYTAGEIAEGVKQIVTDLRAGLPTTKLLLLGVFPRGPNPGGPRLKTEEINRLLSALNDPSVRYLDIGATFMDKNEKISPEVMPDYLHLSEKGYRLWGEAMAPTLQELLETK